MKLETRLGLSAAVGLAATVGLAVLLYMYLPASMEEFVRRDAEERNSQAARMMNAELLRLGESLGQSLTALASELPESEADPQGYSSEQVELAEKLARKHALDELYLIEKDGRLRSAWPQAARIGMKDDALREKARAAENKAVFGMETEKGLFILRAASAPQKAPGILLLALLRIENDELKRMATGIGLEFSGIIAGTENRTPEGTYALPLEGAGGERAATLHLSASTPQSRMLLRSLSRRILTAAIPWVLLTALLLVWLAWPPRRRER